MLFGERGHDRPMVVDMRHPVLVQQSGISLTKQTWIADFNRVPKVCGQGSEEGIEPSEKLICGQAMPLELEQERPCVTMKVRLSVGLQHELHEGADIEEARVRLTSSCPVSSMRGIGRDGDFFPDLAAHLEVVGDLVQVACELIGRGGPIERGVIANGAKERFTLIEIPAVFPETVSRKARLRIPASVDLPLPAFIGPRRSPKTDEGGDRSTGRLVCRKQSHGAYTASRVVRQLVGES